MKSRFPYIICILLFFVGCGGSRAKIHFDSAQYPISLSPTVLTQNGEILTTKNQKKVGTLQTEKTSWSTLWTTVSLNKIDFSKEINRIIKEKGGEAIVNLSIENKTTPLNIFGIFYLHWLPFWVGSSIIEIKGDIIKTKEKPQVAMAKK